MTKTLPQSFDWPVFWLAFALMAAPVTLMARRIRRAPQDMAAGAGPTSVVAR